MSIKKKLITMMVTLSIIPLLLLSVISLKYLSKSLEEEAISQCREVVAGTKLEVNNYLSQTFTTLKVIARSPSISSLSIPQAKAFLVEVQKAYPESIFTLDDTKGMQIARSDNSPLTSIADRDYFKAALQGSDEALSEISISKNTGKASLMLATPVYSPGSGPILGVVHATIGLERLSGLVSKLSNDTNLIYIIDSKGQVVAHPDGEITKKRLDMSQIPFVQQGLTSKASGFAVLDSEAEKKLVTYAYDQKTGWLICQEIPYSVITAKTHMLTIILGTVTLVFLLLIAFLAYYLSQKVTKPITGMQQIALKISGGDLTQKLTVSSKDELGSLAQALNTMVDNLKSIIRLVQDNAQQVAASAEQLTASADQSSQAANQVAQSITEVAHKSNNQTEAVGSTTSTVAQMTENIQKAAENTNQVSDRVKTAAATAQEGGKSASIAVSQMEKLEGTVKASAQVVSKLGERSKEIGMILDTIQGIAGQTNLLALNAAIEAARAGEQGRGFAVVAEEVRKLAEQSQDAAKQIAELIREIQNETDNAVQSMHKGTLDVQTGASVVKEAGEAFRQIITMVTQVSQDVADISASMQQVATGSQRIVTSVNDIDQLTQAVANETQTVSAATEEQSASMQEIAASSQSLAKLADDLQQAVHKFKI